MTLQLGWNLPGESRSLFPSMYMLWSPAAAKILPPASSALSFPSLLAQLSLWPQGKFHGWYKWIVNRRILDV